MRRGVSLSILLLGLVGCTEADQDPYPYDGIWDFTVTATGTAGANFCVGGTDTTTGQVPIVQGVVGVLQVAFNNTCAAPPPQACDITRCEVEGVVGCQVGAEGQVTCSRTDMQANEILVGTCASTSSCTVDAGALTIDRYAVDQIVLVRLQ